MFSSDNGLTKAIGTVVLTVHDLSLGNHFCCKNQFKQLIGQKVVCEQFMLMG